MKSQEATYDDREVDTRGATYEELKEAVAYLQKREEELKKQLVETKDPDERISIMESLDMTHSDLEDWSFALDEIDPDEPDDV